jgi:hypothetical protein
MLCSRAYVFFPGELCAMPIIDHERVLEVPWRPGYRKWDLVGPRVGMSSNLSYFIAEAGTGAPLHLHRDEELIVVPDGAPAAQP